MQIFKIFKDHENSKIKDPYQVLAYTATISLSTVYLGYTFVYLSTIDFKVITKLYNIDFDVNLAEGILQAIISIGGMFGGLFPSYLVQKLSRKQLMLLFNVVAMVLCVGSLHRSYYVFLAVRFLQGACSASMNSIAPMIIKQNSPAEMLTLTGACTNFFMTFGILFVYLFALLLGVVTGDATGEMYWQVIFLFPLTFLLLQLWLLIKVYPYQTCKYLALNKPEELKSLVKRFYKEEYVDLVVWENFKSYREESHIARKKAVYYSKTAFIFGFFYAFMRPITGFGIVLVYSKELLASIFPSFKPMLGTFNMLIFLVFSTISLGFVQKYGRKYMAIIGTYGITVAHFTIATAFFLGASFPLLSKLISLVGIIFYFYVFGMTYGPILWIWLAQAIQPRYLGYTVMANWLGAALTTLIYPSVKANVSNQGYIFLFFGLATICCLPVINKLMIETKGKSQEMIGEQYAELDGKLWNVPRKSLLEFELIQKQKDLMGTRQQL